MQTAVGRRILTMLNFLESTHETFDWFGLTVASSQTYWKQVCYLLSFRNVYFQGPSQLDPTMLIRGTPLRVTNVWLSTPSRSNKARWVCRVTGIACRISAGLLRIGSSVNPFRVICIVSMPLKSKGHFHILKVCTASIKMREIDASHVKETSFTCSLVINWIHKAYCGFRTFERSCLQQRRLFTFVCHHAFGEVSCGMLTKVCKACINYFNLSFFLHYPLAVWSHIFTGCSQGGKVTFGNMLYTFN